MSSDIYAEALPIAKSTSHPLREVSSSDHVIADVWRTIAKDSEFLTFERRKATVTWLLLSLSLSLYFAFPVVAGFFPELLHPRVVGPINVGLLFAIAEVIVAFCIAFTYVRLANGDFDNASMRIVKTYFGGR